MIPKILHFIWFGCEKLPYNIIDSWKELHEDYDIMVWTEKNMIKIKNIDHWNTANTRYNQKSDIYRYEILHKYGGVYVDMDIYCVNRIPSYIHDKNLYTCFEKRGVVCNSFIGCSPNHKLMHDIIEDISHNYDYKTTIWKCTGPLLFTKHISMLNIDNTTIIDTPEKINMCSAWSKKLIIDPVDFNKFLNTTVDIINIKKNKDLQFKFAGIKNPIGVQLWLGGCCNNYKALSDKTKQNVKLNLNNYIDLIFKYQNQNHIFDTSVFRLN